MLDKLSGANKTGTDPSVVGLAVDTRGLRVAYTTREGTSTEQYLDGKTIPLFEEYLDSSDKRGHNAVMNACFSHQACLIGPYHAADEPVPVADELTTLLESVHNDLSTTVDHWDGATVVSVPSFFPSDTVQEIKNAAIASGFDIHRVLPIDAVDSVADMLNARGRDTLGPRIVVEVGYDGTTVSLVQRTVSENRIRVAERRTLDTGEAKTDFGIASSLLEHKYDIPFSEQSPGLINSLREPIYNQRSVDSIDELTDTELRLEVDGKHQVVPISSVFVLQWMDSYGDLLNDRVFDVISSAGYTPDEISEISLTGLGVLGPTRDLIRQSLLMGLDGDLIPNDEFYYADPAFGPECSAAYMCADLLMESSTDLTIYE